MLNQIESILCVCVCVQMSMYYIKSCKRVRLSAILHVYVLLLTLDDYGNRLLFLITHSLPLWLFIPTLQPSGRYGALFFFEKAAMGIRHSARVISSSIWFFKSNLGFSLFLNCMCAFLYGKTSSCECFMIYFYNLSRNAFSDNSTVIHLMNFIVQMSCVLTCFVIRLSYFLHLPQVKDSWN